MAAQMFQNTLDSAALSRVQLSSKTFPLHTWWISGKRSSTEVAADIDSIATGAP